METNVYALEILEEEQLGFITRVESIYVMYMIMKDLPNVKL